MVGPVASDPKWVLIGVVNSLSAQGLGFTASLLWLQERSSHILCLFACLFSHPLMAAVLNVRELQEESLLADIWCCKDERMTQTTKAYYERVI